MQMGGDCLCLVSGEVAGDGGEWAAREASVGWRGGEGGIRRGLCYPNIVARRDDTNGVRW
jgi:hypothetical protein